MITGSELNRIAREIKPVQHAMELIQEVRRLQKRLARWEGEFRTPGSGVAGEETPAEERSRGA